MKFVHEKHLVERQKTKVETSSLRTLEIMPRNPNESVRLRIPSLSINKRGFGIYLMNKTRGLEEDVSTVTKINAAS